MKKYFIKYWPLIILAILSLSISWPIFMQGYFFHHDDLQVMRVFEMRKCFEDLQIPCRWVPDMGYGNGYPLFNYYSVLPYYIGAVFSYFVGFVWAAKLLFLITVILGSFAMFYLGKELFGEKGGFISAVLYLFAPYRALDIYVRGAVAESFAISIVPLVFYFSLKLLRKNNLFNLLGFAVSLGLFLLCHNIMTLFFVPVLFIWNLYWLIKEKFTNFKMVILGAILGFGIAAFFIGPAYLEQSLIQADTLLRGGTDFRAHYVGVSQLFLDRSWGYGGSVFGPNDSISFQIGWPLWWLVVISSLFIVYRFFSRRKIDGFGLFLAILFLISIFMMHNKSTPVWDTIAPLQYAQFPWRFLSLTIFSGALFGGVLLTFIKEKWQTNFLILMTVITVLLNWSYFKPKDFYPWVDDHVKLSDPLWEIQQKAGILDYLPVTAYEPFSRAEYSPNVREGKADLSNYFAKSNSFSFRTTVHDNATIDVPVFDFPNWKTFVNGKEYPHSDKGFIGRIRLKLLPGDYIVTGKFGDTAVRIISNLISLVSLTAIFVLLLLRKKLNKRL